MTDMAVAVLQEQVLALAKLVDNMNTRLQMVEQEWAESQQDLNRFIAGGPDDGWEELS